MKAAIIYATHHGTTEKVAEMLKEKLGETSVDLINLKKTKHIDLFLYDTILIGGSIHAGQVQAIVKTFCNRNLLELLRKNTALYLCAMNNADYEKQYEAAFPELLRKKAIVGKTLGGEFLFEKMNFFEKLIVRKITGVKETKSKIDRDAIDLFANKLIEFKQ